MLHGPNRKELDLLLMPTLTNRPRFCNGTRERARERARGKKTRFKQAEKPPQDQPSSHKQQRERGYRGAILPSAERGEGKWTPGVPRRQIQMGGHARKRIDGGWAPGYSRWRRTWTTCGEWRRGPRQGLEFVGGLGLGE